MRICTMSDSGCVEDEYHFISLCSKYDCLKCVCIEIVDNFFLLANMKDG